MNNFLTNSKFSSFSVYGISKTFKYPWFSGETIRIPNFYILYVGINYIYGQSVYIYHVVYIFSLKPYLTFQIFSFNLTTCLDNGGAVVSYFITMAELHGFVTPTNLIIEFDGEDIVPRQKPRYILDSWQWWMNLRVVQCRILL